MSTLRPSLKKPKTWLALFAAILLLGVIDSFRLPENQLTAWGYIKIVHLYQWGGRPLLKGRVKCRFHPSCSEYSIEAVETYGIRRGLVLTFKRLSCCTHDIPLGTVDPIPPLDE